jgi:uncharacterized membrane protein YhhN
MNNHFIIVAALVLLVLLLYFEYRGQRNAHLASKTLLSILFVFTAVIQPDPLKIYFYPILTGLIFCLAGDVLLALPQKKMFFYGLVAFLLGHICYCLAFFQSADLNLWTGIGALGSLTISTVIYLWLKPSLGDLHLPVFIYILVITTMVIGACTVFGDDRLRISGVVLVFVGAWSFYFSDVFVARQRFLEPGFLNALVGLPLYYFGQFLLAFSVGFLRPG